MEISEKSTRKKAAAKVSQFISNLSHQLTTVNKNIQGRFLVIVHACEKLGKSEGNVVCGGGINQGDIYHEGF